MEPGSGPPLILDANETALQMRGYSRQKRVGQPVLDIAMDLTSADFGNIPRPATRRTGSRPWIRWKRAGITSRSRFPQRRWRARCELCWLGRGRLKLNKMLGWPGYRVCRHDFHEPAKTLRRWVGRTGKSDRRAWRALLDRRAGRSTELC